MARILKNATGHSLVLLDEIGRGTSTFDGMSIAGRYEYICYHIGAKTFCHHYHELTALEDELPGVVNLSVAVKDTGDNVIFLKKVLPGRADKSYGIHVAGLAGLPHQVIKRAADFLEQMENQGQVVEKPTRVMQLNLFSSEGTVAEELKQMDLDEITPREALNWLYNWQDKLVPGEKKGARAK